MTDTIRIFVNASVLDLPADADVAQAVQAYDPSLEAGLATGATYVTDGRGIEMALDSRLTNGAILRVGVRAKRRDDAHP